MLAVLLISPQCVKNFSDNFNKIRQQILANHFSEQLMNKTYFYSKIDCLLLPEMRSQNRVFVFKERAKKKGVEP